MTIAMTLVNQTLSNVISPTITLVC